MDIIPILSTVILIATIITLIVAIASYAVFRIKEKRREARASSAFARKRAMPTQSATFTPLEAGNKEVESPEQSGVDLRKEKRRGTVVLSAATMEKIADRRVPGSDPRLSEETQQREQQPVPETVPQQAPQPAIQQTQPMMPEQQQYRQADPSYVPNVVVNTQYAMQAPQQQVPMQQQQPQQQAPGYYDGIPQQMPEQPSQLLGPGSTSFQQGRKQPAFDDTNPFEQENQPQPQLGGAQAAFMNMFNTQDGNVQPMPGNLNPQQQQGIDSNNPPPNETIKLRRFQASGKRGEEMGNTGFDDDKNAWK